MEQNNNSDLREQTLKEKTAKGVFWGGTSSALQLLLNLAFGIVLARILDAGDYGIIGMLAIFSVVAGILQDGGFTAALANKKDVTHEDYNAIFWFGLLSSLLMYAILFFSAPLISGYFNEPQLLLLSRVLFINIIISGIGVIPIAYLFKHLMIKQRAISDIISLLCSGAAGVILALNGFVYWGLAIQTLIYVTVGTCIRWYFIKWKPTLNINFSPLKEMFVFSSKIFITSLFYQASANIYSVILGRYYNATQVGDYTQGNKWQAMGASLVTSVFTLITQPLFVQAEVKNTDPVKVFRKLVRLAAFLSFPLLLGLAFIGKEFITIAIGEKWLPCVPIIQILCLWSAALPIWRLYNDFLISKGRSDYYMIINIITGSLQILFAFIMYPYGIIKMLIVFLFINFGGLLLCHYYTRKIINLRIIDVMKDILPYLLITIGIYIISYFLVYYIENLYLRFALKLIIPIILYLIIMSVTKSVMFKESVDFLKQQVLKMK